MTDTAQACEWKYDDIDNFYAASCGRSFCFTDEGVKGNEFVYCPYCGKKIHEVE